MPDTHRETRRAELNRELELLEDQLAATPIEDRGPIVEQIEQLEQEMRELAQADRRHSGASGRRA